MRRQVAWSVAVVLLGFLGGAAAAGLDEATVIGEVSAADHEVEQGSFTVGDGAALIVKPGSHIYQFLASHRGQKIRLMIEGARDGVAGNPVPPTRERPGVGPGEPGETA